MRHLYGTGRLAADAGLYVPLSVIPVSSVIGTNRCITTALRTIHGAMISAVVASSSAGTTHPGRARHTAKASGKITTRPLTWLSAASPVSAPVAAIQGPLGEVLQAVRDTLEETPPELASDVAKDGILLAGGGTLIRGFRELVADETGMPVFSAESPLTCVVFGSGQALDHLDKLARTSRNRRPSLTPDWRTS